MEILSFSLTAAQLRSGNSAPIVVVPGVAGRVILPLDFFFDLEPTSVFSAAPTWSFRYPGLAFDFFGTFQFALTGVIKQPGHLAFPSVFSTNAALRGSDLELRSTADVTGGVVASCPAVLWYMLTP